MRTLRPAVLISAVLTALALSACSPGGAPIHLRLPSLGGPGFDKGKLESAIDASFGGTGTCVIIADTASGAELYRYNSNAKCEILLPPCSTFEIPSDLIALDAGVITPQTVLSWDHTPQPIKSWQSDSSLKAAFRESIIWWNQALAEKVGQATYRDRLKAFDYGNKAPDGPPASFWMGPSVGGQLGLSTRQQAQFLHRFYAGKLPVKPESLQAVEAIMVDEIRGGSTMSGKTGSCASVADRSRQVGWWVGRLKSAKTDYVFAASVDGESENSLPGIEVQDRVKTAFAEAGLWPAAQ